MKPGIGLILTLLAALVGVGPLPVNSTHHQAVKAVAAGLLVSARSPAGRRSHAVDYGHGRVGCGPTGNHHVLGRRAGRRAERDRGVGLPAGELHLLPEAEGGEVRQDPEAVGVVLADPTSRSRRLLDQWLSGPSQVVLSVLAGAVLVLVGARWEWVRARGRRTRAWAAQLR